MTNSNISQAANLLNRGASANNSQLNTSIRQDGQGNAVRSAAGGARRTVRDASSGLHASKGKAHSPFSL